MSSAFEDAPQDVRTLSEAAAPPRPRTRTLAAFAAGIACTALVSAVVAWPRQAWHGAQSSQPHKVPSRKVAASLESNSRAVRDSAAGMSAAAAAPVTAATPEAGSQQAARPGCERQTWPYVSHDCDDGQGRPTRSVRVITTDRSAPTMVKTAAPRVPVRTTDGSAPAAQAVGPGTPRATDSTTQLSNVALRQDLPASPWTAQSSTDISPAVEPSNGTANAKGQDTSKQAGTSSRDRRGARNSDEPSRSRHAARRAKQNAENEAVRVVGRAASQDDDNGYTYVRSYRPREGRQAGGRRQVVQQKPAEAQRAAAREPPPSVPFLFNPAATGN